MKRSRDQDVLESRVNNIFAKMHGQRQVVIDEKYRVSLLTTHIDENSTPMNQRDWKLKNLAFVAGLMDMARDKIASKVRRSLELGSNPILGHGCAVFSADGDHISNICILPGIAEQVIMFIMQKDWSLRKSSWAT